MEHTGHSIPQHWFLTLEMFLQEFLEAYSFHQRWMIIPQIEFNPKDVEQHSEINSNCDQDCYQVIFSLNFSSSNFCLIQVEFLPKWLGLYDPTGKINGIESIAINLPARACLFFTQKAGDDEEDANYFNNQGRTLFFAIVSFLFQFFNVCAFYIHSHTCACNNIPQ